MVPTILKMIMHAGGLLQEQIAVEAEMNQGRLSLLSNAKAKPSASEAAKLHKRFELPADVLTEPLKGENEDMNDPTLTNRLHKFFWNMLTVRGLLRLFDRHKKELAAQGIKDAHALFEAMNIDPIRITKVLLGEKEITLTQRDYLYALFDENFWRRDTMERNIRTWKVQLYKLRKKIGETREWPEREVLHKQRAELEKQITMEQIEMDAIPPAYGHVEEVFKNYPTEWQLEKKGLIIPKHVTNRQILSWKVSPEGESLYRMCKQFAGGIDRLGKEQPSKQSCLSIIENIKGILK